MQQLRIRHFGPIKEGLSQNSGWLIFDKVTVLIGNTGSGKSTVAKLYSTLNWLEKVLTKGELKPEQLVKGKSFVKHLAYQNIANYLNAKTEIEYKGDAYHFHYQNSSLVVTKLEDSHYSVPKILYYPAERSLVGVLDRPEKMRGLPDSIYTFLYEYDKARNHFAKGFSIPFLNAKFEYSKLNKLGYIVNGNYKLKMSETASGIQTALPMLMVAQYLNKVVDGQINDENNISVEQFRLLAEKVQKASKSQRLDGSSLTNEISTFLANTSNTRVVNIIEEPELNLFPTTQKQVLFNLLELNVGDNQLVFTTHSPYLISYLALAIKAHQIDISRPGKRYEISKVVPYGAAVPGQQVKVYELDEVNGTIALLDDIYGIPSDEHLLNAQLQEVNRSYNELQKIKQS